MREEGKKEGTESGGVVCHYYTVLNGMKMWVKNVISKYTVGAEIMVLMRNLVANSRYKGWTCDGVFEQINTSACIYTLATILIDIFLYMNG